MENGERRTENREQRTESRNRKTEIGSSSSVLRSLFSALRFPFSVLCFLFSVLCSLFSPPVHAAEPTPAMLKNVGIEPRLGKTVPLSLEFTDASGQTVSLRNYFDGTKPVILVLAYYECPNLCTFVLNGMVEGLQKMSWTAGKEFQIVIVSIDPKETPKLAGEKKKSYLNKYGREGVSGGWRFLVGKEKNIRSLADAVGFKYAYDESIRQYAHAAGLFILTPEGKLARTLFGIQFSPRDLRLALTEASEGKIGTVLDKILLFCYAYDPKASRYVLFASNLMKAGGALTVLALGFALLRLGRKRG